MSARIEALKKHEFQVEECPKCHGESDDCDICKGSGVFQQKLRSDWVQPNLQTNQRLVAYLDFDEWGGFYLEENGEVLQELDFPFDTDFATGKHFTTIGFKVEQ